jgi:hypothetical protein
VVRLTSKKQQIPHFVRDDRYLVCLELATTKNVRGSERRPGAYFPRAQKRRQDAGATGGGAICDEFMLCDGAGYALAASMALRSVVSGLSLASHLLSKIMVGHLSAENFDHCGKPL